jgi:hypothetical protein
MGVGERHGDDSVVPGPLRHCSGPVLVADHEGNDGAASVQQANAEPPGPVRADAMSSSNCLRSCFLSVFQEVQGGRGRSCRDRYRTPLWGVWGRRVPRLAFEPVTCQRESTAPPSDVLMMAMTRPALSKTPK